jgi:dTDP-4-amino-4,6-dideoxygalactose transaminase
LTLNSGTDSLVLALYSLGIRKNDEVITVPNSFIATVSAIVHLGAKPIFVDVNEDQNIDPSKIEAKITKKTKLILPVHLTGRVSNMSKIMKVANKYKIPVIEDSAQSFLSKVDKKYAGTFGKIGCFSLHPLKNFNAFGDSGFLVTNSRKIYEKIKLLRNHGLNKKNNLKEFGYVSRMDNIQAALVLQNFTKIKKIIQKRRKNADYYIKNLTNKIFKNYEELNQYNTYHTFVIQVKNRSKLQKYLLSKGIETKIHYPYLINYMKEFSKNNFNKDTPNALYQRDKILSLPIHQYLTQNQLKYTVDTINSYYDT